MSEKVEILEILSSSSEDEVTLIVENSLLDIDAESLVLPGPNWAFYQMGDNTLFIYEVAMIPNSFVPQIRKYLCVNLSKRKCASYVMDFKLSEMTINKISDIEQCIEELYTMQVCNGGPTTSEIPPVSNLSLRIDTFGTWRNNSCKIFVTDENSSCTACKTLPNDLKKLKLVKERKDFLKEASIADSVSKLSHRQHSQITSLQKRYESSYKKKKMAEKEMKVIEAMILEVLEQSERKNCRVPDDSETDESND